MPLSFSNTPNGSGGYTPYVRYMAGTASWSTADGNFQFSKAAFDLGNIKTGWCYLAAGTPPEWVMDESLESQALRPEGDDWKRGFKVNIMSKDMFGNDEPVREWGTSSVGATMAIQKLYADWEATADREGKAAVVQFSGATPTKVGKGSTNVPIFSILKMIDLPAELAEVSGSGDAGSPSPAPVAAASEPSSDDEF